MTSRAVTLVGYGILALAAVCVEVSARGSGRVGTFGQAVAALCRRLPLRLLLLAGWLWLGWHLFVRVDWR